MVPGILSSSTCSRGSGAGKTENTKEVIQYFGNTGTQFMNKKVGLLPHLGRTWCPALSVGFWVHTAEPIWFSAALEVGAIFRMVRLRLRQSDLGGITQGGSGPDQALRGSVVKLFLSWGQGASLTEKQKLES
jgi:hypothetical protein